MENGSISKLRIYPIKSLGHIDVEIAEVGRHSLKNDRLFAMVGEDGRYVNGKRTSLVNQLKTEFNLPSSLVWFSDKRGGAQTSFELREGNAHLDSYLSDFFGIQLKLRQNDQGQFMDIPVQSSLTIVSEASLQSLRSDLDRHSLESMRLRFRTNVELTGVPAYGEEKFYKEPGIGMRFKMGDVEMIGISPRARCNVPPQDPETGAMDRSFVKHMIESRDSSMPNGSTLLQYGRSAYFLAINVYIPESEVGKKLELGNRIEIIESVSFT